jgi:hypothetical protein
MTAYSFMSCTATLTGPGGEIDLGYGAGVADEGITITRAEDANTMQTGADGSVMHSLHAAQHGVVTVRLLKTSPTNAMLMSLYNYQRSSPANWGQNNIVVRDSVRGDGTSALTCAFKKVPDLSYAKDGNLLEWSFDAGQIDSVLG